MKQFTVECYDIEDHRLVMRGYVEGEKHQTKTLYAIKQQQAFRAKARQIGKEAALREMNSKTPYTMRINVKVREQAPNDIIELH